jgi:hypothetical protein
VRVLYAIGRLLATRDALVTLGLVTAAAVASPPHDGGSRLAVVMLVLTGTVLHAIKSASAPGTRLERPGPWARATVALGGSSSVPMIVEAIVAAIE